VVHGQCRTTKGYEARRHQKDLSRINIMTATLLRTAALGALFILPAAHAQQIWQQHEFFQNSESVTSYF
jgi:hypothetical protein